MIAITIVFLFDFLRCLVIKLWPYYLASRSFNTGLITYVQGCKVMIIRQSDNDPKSIRSKQYTVVYRSAEVVILSSAVVSENDAIKT